jgi:hypothetical protein
MTALLVASLVAAVVWLAVLTVTQLVVIRQLSALTVRSTTLWSSLGSGASSAFAPTIGFRLGEETAKEYPDLVEGRRLVVSVSTTCNACVDLVDQLLDGRLPRGVTDPEMIMLVSGPPDDVLAALETRFNVWRDPDATSAARALSLSARPGAVLLEEGLITGVAMPRDMSDLDGLAETAPRTVETPQTGG